MCQYGSTNCSTLVQSSLCAGSCFKGIVPVPRGTAGLTLNHQSQGHRSHSLGVLDDNCPICLPVLVLEGRPALSCHIEAGPPCCFATHGCQTQQHQGPALMAMADARSDTPNMPACSRQVSGRMCRRFALCSQLLAQSAHQYAGTVAQLYNFVSTRACSTGQPTHHDSLGRIQGDLLLGQVCEVLLKQGLKGGHPYPLHPITAGIL